MAQNQEISNPWDQSEKQSKKQKRLLRDIESMWGYAAEINHLLNPHYNMLDDSCYGENDVNMLLKNIYVHSDLWPQPTTSVLCPKLTKDQIIQFYQNLFDKMVKAYSKHMIDNNYMHSFDYISKHDNIIDMTKSFDHECQIDMPDIVFYEHEIETLRSYGWYTFIPCFNEFVIKVNKRRYIHVTKTHIDKNNKTITVKIKDYTGNRYDWITNGYALVEFSFETENNDGLPCNTKVIETQSYEQCLTDYIHEMNWDKSQIAFWLDMFGTNFPDEMVLADFDKTNQTEINCKAILLSEKDYFRLLSISKTLDIETERTQETAKSYLEQQVSNKLIIEYFKCIAVINHNIFIHMDENSQNDIQMENVNGKFTKTINNMTIKSNVYPKIITAKGETQYE